MIRINKKGVSQNMEIGLIVIVVLMVGMFFFSSRKRKKQEQQEALERDNLQVGDEVTTIGGIIGKVVSIREETFVLETTKDKTKIRFLRGAIRTVDVKIADVVAAKAKEATAASGAAEQPAEPAAEEKSADKKEGKKKKK